MNAEVKEMLSRPISPQQGKKSNKKGQQLERPEPLFIVRPQELYLESNETMFGMLVE